MKLPDIPMGDVAAMVYAILIEEEHKENLMKKIEEQPVVKCTSCNANIRFVKMISGKTMPIDTKKITIIVPDEMSEAYPSGEPAVCKTITGYQSHFSTCPKADQHRRPKDNSITRMGTMTSGSDEGADAP